MLHSHRLNLPFLRQPGLLLVSIWSSFLGTTNLGLTHLLILWDIMPTSPSCLISWSTNSQYFSGMVYGFNVIGVLSVLISSSIRLVLPIYVAVWDMMWMYFLLSNSCSLYLASSGIFTSGIDLNNGLVLGSNSKLLFGVFWILSLWCHTVACSHLLPGLPHTSLLMLA